MAIGFVLLREVNEGSVGRGDPSEGEFLNLGTIDILEQIISH